jgi:chitosanase
VNGDNGHAENDVLYVAFPGDEAVLGEKAHWKAKNYHDFERSIMKLGNRLIRCLF